MSRESKLTIANHQSTQSRVLIRGFTLIFTLFILLLITTLFAIGHGAFHIRFSTVLSVLLDPIDLSFTSFSDQESAILWAIRLPDPILFAHSLVQTEQMQALFLAAWHLATNHESPVPIL